MQNDESTFRVLDWAFTAVAGLLGVIWTMQSKRIDKIESRADDAAKALRETENAIDRKLSALFDRLEEHSRRSYDQHMQLMSALHDGLDRKADK